MDRSSATTPLHRVTSTTRMTDFAGPAQWCRECGTVIRSGN
ncbi:MAG: hypothetical protein VB106_12485 [Clostridiaceae bacterium]|nr:hypothetical protein [Clostridiaceae bacterium]